MLIAQVTDLAAKLLASPRALLAGSPEVMELPPTLELAAIGAVIITGYAIATRSIWRRASGGRASQITRHAKVKRPVPKSAAKRRAKDSSRGAA